MRRSRKNPHRTVHRDKKFQQMERDHADEMRRRHRHVEKKVVEDADGVKVIIAAVENAVAAAPFVPNVKGMRWQDGKLVPRKGGPR